MQLTTTALYGYAVTGIETQVLTCFCIFILYYTRPCPRLRLRCNLGLKDPHFFFRKIYTKTFHKNHSDRRGEGLFYYMLTTYMYVAVPHVKAPL